MYTSLIPIALVALAGASDTGAVRRAPFDADAVLTKMRSAYEALASYADSGTVLDESTGFTDRSTFRTLFTRLADRSSRSPFRRWISARRISSSR